MKNILYLITFLCLTLTSCADDDTVSAEPTNNPVLVTKITEINNGGPEKVSEYIYEGTKITTVLHNYGGHENYFYTDDRISSIKYYEDEDLVNEDFFEYNSSGQLVKIKTISPNGYEWGEIYSYDSFGVNIDYYMIDPQTQQELIAPTGSSFQIENNNIVSTIAGDDLKSFTFDSKSDPFINISGFNPLTLFYSLGRLGVNNVTGRNQSYNIPSTTTYTYNPNNFPLTSLEVYENGNEISKEYFYND